eukprot:g17853.t1
MLHARQDFTSPQRTAFMTTARNPPQEGEKLVFDSDGSRESNSRATARTLPTSLVNQPPRQRFCDARSGTEQADPHTGPNSAPQGAARKNVLHPLTAQTFNHGILLANGVNSYRTTATSAYSYKQHPWFDYPADRRPYEKADQGCK